MGLVLSRRQDEAFVIELPGAVRIVVTVTETHRSSCKLHVHAPLGVTVVRAELEPKPAPLRLEEDRSVEQQRADGDYPNPYANNEGDE